MEKSPSLVKHFVLQGSPHGKANHAGEQISRLIGAARAHPALLVSVRNAAEARQALNGGCEILDVKEPNRGSLGMADVAEISRILDLRDSQSPTIPVSIALGEATEWQTAGEVEGQSFGPLSVELAGGIHFLKLGTAGLGNSADWCTRYRQARRQWNSQITSQFGTTVPQWVAVAYADWKLADSPPPVAVISGAADCGCSGLLIDTFTKSAGGLFHWLDIDELRQLAIAAREYGLWFALAGGLALDDLPRLKSIAPDVIGIRTAACHDRQRIGEVDPAAVRTFRWRLEIDCQR